ncbi:MAG: mercuric reductase [Acidobacteriota bacterium]
MARTTTGPDGTYNLVVIGAGTAGLVTAAGTAGLGGRVALVERGRMGGDCLNTGCVPSKALISSARLIDRIRRSSNLGLNPQAPLFDFERIVARMRECRARLSEQDSQARFEGLGVDVYRGEAKFLSPREVQVGDIRLRARNFLIAAGSRAAVPPIEGLESVRYYTNETVFDELDTAPERLAILGGGPIGCELGQAFAHLGVRVTILQRSPQILEKEDADVAGLLRRCLESSGISVVAGIEVKTARVEGKSVRLSYGGDGHEDRSGVFDAVLVATGRVPNTDSLGLEAAGVAFTRKGVTVNSHLQTSQPHIYAAGDIVGTFQFTHVADHHARIVVRNVLFPWLKARVEERVIPWCTFTSPEIARVGWNENQARAMGVAYDVFLQPFGEVDRAILESEEIGFAKVLTKKGSDRILGATVVCERAGDVLQEFVVAMKNGIGLKAIGNTIHPYPTVVEVARKIADQQQKSRLKPPVKRALRWLYRRRLP